MFRVSFLVSAQFTPNIDHNFSQITVVHCVWLEWGKGNYCAQKVSFSKNIALDIWKASIEKFFLRNRFHVTSRILCPTVLCTIFFLLQYVSNFPCWEFSLKAG